MGTPITGSLVSAARTPAKWAAPPAPAISTLRPRLLAELAYSYTLFGERCADATVISAGIPKLVSTSRASCITGKSESLPITTPTMGFCWEFTGC